MAAERGGEPRRKRERRARRPAPAPVGGEGMREGGAEAAALAPFLERDVVLDTRGPLIYIGRLAGADRFFFTLANVDVHDMHDSHTPKEKYILDARKTGIKTNRARVLVRRDEVVSLSLLEDVVEY